MATVTPMKKSCSVNPLKSSTPLGAALAYLGIEGAVPLFHGSQGCTSFALVLAVRHFKEAIPLQTTAMNEAATVLGGAENLEEALLNVHKRMKPKFIGVASTALVETRGEDFAGELRSIRRKREELDDVKVAFASTPDFEGALEEGWSRATAAAITALVAPGVVPRTAGHINLLPGVHQTPGDVEELVDLIESFGLEVTVLPDVSHSLDGSVPDQWVATSLGGTPLQDAEEMGRSSHTIALGEHMRLPAQTLHERCGVPFTVLPGVLGLEASDSLVALLMELSGRPAPPRLQRQRSQLVDAMLDSHFWFGGRKVAVATDADLLRSLGCLFASMGAEVSVAIASTKGSPALKEVPCEQVRVGDLWDLEQAAAECAVDLLVTHSHGNLASARLGIPLYRVGFPVFDRLGAQHHCSVGYRGTREVLYELANVFMGEHHEPAPKDFGVVPAREASGEVQHA